MTDRLTPTDTAFLYGEEASTPLHVGGVVIVEPKGPFDFQRVIDVISRRLGELPRFRQVVRTVPGHFARPVWVDDAHFDLTYHVRRSSLPQPGSAQQLDELVGRLISRPLDRSRPLWELYIVEGLAGGRVALVNKTHEALVSRIGAVDIAAAVLDETAHPTEKRDTPWVPAPEPSAVDLVVDAVGDLAAQPSEALDAARLWIANLRQTAVGAFETGAAMADVARRSMRRTPRSSMTIASPGPRIFAASDIDLSAVKSIRAAQGGTVNDVILAIVAGAVRSWMLYHGDPVTGGASLATLVPLSVRPDGPDDAAGVVSYLIDLPIAEPSPVLRLHQVSFQMKSHTQSGRQVSADALLALGRFAPATLHAMGARVAGQLSRRSYDLLVTNVPGPQRRLYAAGDPVVGMYPVVPLVKGHALAIGCTSYRGRVCFGFTADRDAMPDVIEFAQLVSDSAAELAETAGASARPARRAAGRGGKDTGARRNSGANTPTASSGGAARGAPSPARTPRSSASKSRRPTVGLGGTGSGADGTTPEVGAPKRGAPKRGAAQRGAAGDRAPKARAPKRGAATDSAPAGSAPSGGATPGDGDPSDEARRGPQGGANIVIPGSGDDAAGGRESEER